MKSKVPRAMKSEGKSPFSLTPTQVYNPTVQSLKQLKKKKKQIIFLPSMSHFLPLLHL